LTTSIRDDFVTYIYRVELVRQDAQPQAPRVQRVQENSDEVAGGAGGAAEGGAAPAMGKRTGGATAQAVSDKVPRNGPCPCGSGRKYKKCHGAAA
jgi:preprotein translocase subunit SecA